MRLRDICREGSKVGIRNLFQRADPDSDMPKKERSRAFFKAAKRVAKYVDTLPLTDEQIKKLFELFAAQIHEAETNAARQGIQMGFDNAKAEFEKYLLHQGVNTNGKRDNP